MAKLVDMSPEEIVDLYASSVETKIATELTLEFFGDRISDDRIKDSEDLNKESTQNLEALRPFLIACVAEGLKQMKETSDN